MSFSQDVKNELCDISENSQKNRDIILCGMLYGMRGTDELLFNTENASAVALMSRLLGDACYDVAMQGKKNSVMYSVTIPAGEAVVSGFEDNAQRILKGGNDVETGLFLRGLFLSCGTITSPDKEYHLELTPCDDERADIICSSVNEHGISVRKSVRKGQTIIYTKDSEQIADFLTYMGAMLHSMEIMNVKIYKEVRNNVNRAVNCEAANLDKTALAAAKQIDAIGYIYENRGKSYLSDELLEIAEIRLQNVDLSLREIGELASPPISRSGVNHRLAKILKIAEELKGQAAKEPAND